MLDGRVLEASQVEYRSGFFLPRSGFRLRSTPRSVFRLRCSFRFCPKKILRKRCGGERIASGVGFHPENPITGPAPKVRQRCCPRSIADRVFFRHSHALPSILLWQQDCSTQSCCGNRIAPPNPAVVTGLLHPILLWQQDCSTQSCCGNRIAPPNPAVLLWQQDCSTQSCCGNRIAPVFPRKRWKRSAVQHYAPRLAARIARKTTAVRRYTPMHSRTRRPDCPENYGSALLYSRTLTEKTGCDAVNMAFLPGLPPGFPASNLGSKNKAMGKIKLFPTQILVGPSMPRVPGTVAGLGEPLDPRAPSSALG